MKDVAIGVNGLFFSSSVKWWKAYELTIVSGSNGGAGNDKKSHHETHRVLPFEEPLSSWRLMVQHQTRSYQLQAVPLLDYPCRFQTQGHIDLNVLQSL